MMRVRFESDPQAVLDFLRAQEYPCPWTIEELRECVRLRVEDGDYTVAYVWAHYIGGTLDMHFHACANRHYPLRWPTRHVLDRLLATAELMSATSLYTEAHGPDASKINRLLSRVGFAQVGDGMSLRLEPHDGPVLQA